jgi:hypothetical protein
LTTEPGDADLTHLRRLLHRRGEQRPEDPAERLARALLEEGPAGVTCADVQALLPEYVEAELRRAAAGRQYPQVAQHILLCAECSVLHALMLDRELAPAPAPLPAPDLAAFRRQAAFEELRAFVFRLTEAMLNAIRPAALPDLADVAEIFFEQVRSLRGELRLQPAAGFALGFGGDLPQAACFLAATCLATQRLGRDLPEERLEALRQSGELSDVARQTALGAASDLGFQQPEATRFAAEYGRLVAAAEARLPAWPPAE